MANLNPRRFTHPETLSRINRDALLKWLAPARGYLETKGVPLPALGSADALDYDKLAAVFLDPEPEMPESLSESLFIIHEMADEHGMDTILEAMEENGVTLNVGNDPEPADVAIQAWLENHKLLEQIHCEYQVNRPRSFVSFLADRVPDPNHAVPVPGKIEGLETQLQQYYLKNKRGSSCRVLVYPKGNECLFLIRHGQACKREVVIKDGQSVSLFYRPQKHDVVMYDSVIGELRVHCCGKKELDEFRQAFGIHLFGEPEAFPGTAKYTLEPLIRDGRGSLVCLDIEGIESVRLTELQFYHGGTPWQKVSRKSDDLFELIERGLVPWPKEARLTRAGFEVKFKDSSRSRKVTILPSNKALYGRDDDRMLVEAWLKARGFIAELMNDENKAVAVA